MLCPLFPHRTIRYFPLILLLFHRHNSIIQHLYLMLCQPTQRIVYFLRALIFSRHGILYLMFFLPPFQSAAALCHNIIFPFLALLQQQQPQRHILAYIPAQRLIFLPYPLVWDTMFDILLYVTPLPDSIFLPYQRVLFAAHHTALTYTLSLLYRPIILAAQFFGQHHTISAISRTYTILRQPKSYSTVYSPLQHHTAFVSLFYFSPPPTYTAPYQRVLELLRHIEHILAYHVFSLYRTLSHIHTRCALFLANSPPTATYSITAPQYHTIS